MAVATFARQLAFASKSNENKAVVRVQTFEKGNTMSAWCRKIADDPRFQTFIVSLILLNALLLGLETNSRIQETYGRLIDAVEGMILAIFVAEIAIRLAAYAPHVLTFFADAWNLFDFFVVALSLLPAVGPMAVVARMARVLRVVRLLSFSRQLRLIVDTLLRSIPSMGHVVLLLSMLIYTYAVLGVTLFRDPRIGELDHVEKMMDQAPFGSEERAKLQEEHNRLRANAQRWGNIGVAAWSMFQTLTFENWVGLQDPLMEQHWWSPLFFISFILLGVFVAMNLFIAVVMNNLEEVKAEERARPHAHDAYSQLTDHLERIKTQLSDFQAALEGVRGAPNPLSARPIPNTELGQA
jgi:voltage-gated sodium channel